MGWMQPHGGPSPDTERTDRQTDRRASTYDHLSAAMGAGRGEGGISHHEFPRKAREGAETAPRGGPRAPAQPRGDRQVMGGPKPPPPSLPVGGPAHPPQASPTPSPGTSSHSMLCHQPVYHCCPQDPTPPWRNPSPATPLHRCCGSPNPTWKPDPWGSGSLGFSQKGSRGMVLVSG